MVVTKKMNCGAVGILAAKSVPSVSRFQLPFPDKLLWKVFMNKHLASVLVLFFGTSLLSITSGGQPWIGNLDGTLAKAGHQFAVTVTNLTANQSISDAVFTVLGTAMAKAGVRNVRYRLNSGAWMTGIGTNAWAAPLVLAQRTNLFQVFAGDATDRYSATSSIPFIYAQGAGLRVKMVGAGFVAPGYKTVGAGFVTPDYNNAVLEVGKDYRLTATAGVGYRFKKWIVATNWDAGAIETARILNFTMQPNLTLTAVFVDSARPAVQVTNLAANQQISNAVFVVKGKAQDNVGVSNVWYQLNNGVWTTAIGTSVWAAPLALGQRTNLFQVFAEDATGNHSLTNSLSFIYVVTDYLTLLNNGMGGISRSFTGNILELGKSYTVKAVPGAGQLFSNWSGTISVANNPLDFVMQWNMVLQANFVPNPFVALKGDYNGLFYPTINGWPVPSGATNAGFITLSLTDRGGFSGKLLLEGETLPFSGAFDLQLQAQVSVARVGKPALAVNLKLNPEIPGPDEMESETNVITGTVANERVWASDLLAYRAITDSSSHAGAYTMLMEGCEDSGACFVNTNVPWGDSPAAVKIGRFGAIQMVGTLSDGASISQGTAVSENGFWPLFVSLYGGRGCLMGWMNLDTNEPVSPLCWLAPPSPPGTCYYTNGFNQWRQTVLTKYVVPPPGQNAVNWTNATVAILGEDLPTGLTNQVVLTNNVLRVVSGTISNFELSITLSNGLFKGSFVHPVTRRVTTFNGALEQNPPEIYLLDSGGWFLGASGEGGIIRFHPE
jgi:hypothetical protein